jgi:hypothetical protein
MSAMISEDEDYVICGSEDGYAYIWNKLNQFVPAINPAYFTAFTISFTGFKSDHNGSVEYFKPFNGAAVTSAQFVPLVVLQKISHCFTAYSPPANVREVIVVCSNDGQIKVLYQFLELG